MTARCIPGPVRHGLRLPRLLLLPLLLLPLLLPPARPAAAADVKAEAGRPSAGEERRRSAEETRRLGEAMYRDGVLPSGEPMKAIVQGDITLSGSMVTCANCHMRSGLGSYEGTVFTLPASGGKLFKPVRSARDLPGVKKERDFRVYKRPAYTEASLARALRSGIDPAGRTMSPTMPRYVLDDDEVEILVSYLKRLSSAPSPGVTAKTIRFAAVVAEGVGVRERDAMVKPLQAYIREEWNGNIAALSAAQREKGYRTLTLDVWKLTGPESTWRNQLEAHYRRQPVFALLGGIAPGSWGPVHAFCEENGIPCVFPLTDLPAISESHWYTLYLSKGYHQEGEAAAKYLARVKNLPPGKPVVQVFRDDDRGQALSRGFEAEWKKLGKGAVAGRTVPPGTKTGGEYWKELAAGHRGAVLLLWLGPEDLTGVEALGTLPERPSTVFFSATMVGGRIGSIPDAIRDFALVTWPRRLPGEPEHLASIVKQWLAARKVPRTDLAVSSNVYFLTRMLAQVLTAMKGDAHRDYFLDLFDLQEDKAVVAPGYPRLTFGRGQRYASKGCYVVALAKGAPPRVVRKSDWIIY